MAIGQIPLVLNQPTHVAVTYDGTGSHNGIEIYVDGVPCKYYGVTDAGYSGMANDNNTLFIGDPAGFDAKMFEIYNICADSLQVQQIKN